MYLLSNKRLLSSLFLCLLLLGGCGFPTTKYYPVWWSPAVSGSFQAQLDEGKRLFVKGDYASAETVFEDLQQSENPVAVHQARYGLACSRFMLAENRQEYLDAIEVMELWLQSPPADTEGEDPRMLLALFSKVLKQVPEGDSKDAASSEKHVLMQFLEHEKQLAGLENHVIDLKRQISDLETQKEVMENAIRAREHTAGAMEEELLKLRQQIKTIETIDQEIQEKKQGISSP